MIVVGVDGLPAGVAAAEWAARESLLRGTALKIVYVVPAWCLEDGLSGAVAGIGAWMREGGRSALAEAVHAARHVAEGIAIDTALLGGDPRRELIEISRQADLLVMGGSGLSSLRGLLVGSVTQGVAGHAHCDVVVVRETAPDRRALVVVGADASEAQDTVLDFAFAAAAARGARLRAVLAWNWRVVAANQTLGEEPEISRRGLAEALAGRGDRYPEVQVSTEIVEGHPVDVLRHAADRADLLVVGSHGHGTLAGMLLGSVSQALLHLAPCPLAVVRVPSRADDDTGHRDLSRGRGPSRSR
ncbi:universal stress protein [Herbidospora daliensis]|uniref:universal stress protein n=1 Tax=Herbidospora daliensis TaxID=295585 RepID=UPI0007856EAF|nr:universal stress protein [Herbidospora daliensis]